MKGKKINSKKFNEIISALLVIVMLLTTLLLNIDATKADPDSNAAGVTILYFEPSGVVYMKTVEIGTQWENLDLPAVLHAVGMIAEYESVFNVDGTSSTATSTSLAAPGLNQEVTDITLTMAENTEQEAGAATPENTSVEDTNNTNNINTSEDDTSSTDTNDESTTDNVVKAIVEMNVPVTWEGEYNSHEPGEYVLTARIDGYNYAGAPPTAIITVSEEGAEETSAPVPNSISGFFWVDGNGDLDTDWDGIFNGYEHPLADYPVTLYHADDLSSPVMAIRTDSNGEYIFEDLDPGSYVLGTIADSVGGLDYLPPVFVTDDNKFAIDWSIPGIPAFTEAIDLEEGQAVEGINAGMRLPMGVTPYASYNENNSLKYLPDAKQNDIYRIDNKFWLVMDTKIYSGVKYVFLIMRGETGNLRDFGDNTNYATSRLRDRINKFVGDNRLPTIHAMAVKPYFGNFSLETDRSLPYDPNSITYENKTPQPEMAGAETVDILFAPSVADIRDWIGKHTDIPSTHPLHHPLPGGHLSFPQRFWFRTPVGSTDNLYGYYYLAQKIDAGINYSSTNISDVPAVWVNAGAVARKVNVYHVDKAGNLIGNPNPDVYSVNLTFPFENTIFTLTDSHIQSIAGYEYKRWKVGPTGAERNETFPVTALTAQEVVSGVDVYLIYEKTSTEVTVTKTVTGDFANKTKDFTFTVYFADSAGVELSSGVTFTYRGGAIPDLGATASQSGGLSLKQGGWDTFTLKHGQTITIEDVPKDYKIKVVETPDNDYWMTYTDSAIAGVFEYDMPYNAVGAGERRFDFLNTRKTIVPTGIDSNAWPVVAFSLATILLILPGFAAIEYIKKKHDN